MRYQLFTFLYPRKFRDSLLQLLVYANIKADPTNFLGFILFFDLLLALFIGFALGRIIEQPVIFIFPLTFFILQAVFYLWLVVYTDKKARFIEEALPDALLLMASNLRAGLTADKAFLLSARPEFGPLKEEITRLGKEITAGKEIGPALLEMTKRVKSKKLSRSIQLISSGIRSGGKLADLLQETAFDFKNQTLVDRKIRASINMYVIFIFIAIAFGAPLLFGLSSYLVEVLTTVFKEVQIPPEATSSFNIPLAIQNVSIEPSFIIFFSILSLIFSSIFGGLIIGLITRGKEKDGLNYIPLLLFLSLFFFFMFRLLAKTLLAGLFGNA